MTWRRFFVVVGRTFLALFALLLIAAFLFPFFSVAQMTTGKPNRTYRASLDWQRVKEEQLASAMETDDLNSVRRLWKALERANKAALRFHHDNPILRYRTAELWAKHGKWQDAKWHLDAIAASPRAQRHMTTNRKVLALKKKVDAHL